MGVAAYTFRSRAFSIVSSEDRTYGALVIGIDPDDEARTSTLPDLIREGEYLSDTDTDFAVTRSLNTA